MSLQKGGGKAPVGNSWGGFEASQFLYHRFWDRLAPAWADNLCVFGK